MTPGPFEQPAPPDESLPLESENVERSEERLEEDLDRPLDD